MNTIKRSVLRATRPRPELYKPDGYDLETWTDNTLLVVGGEFLRDPATMSRLIPKRGPDEAAASYLERIDRAFYVPFASKVIARLVAGVLSDPPTPLIESGEGDKAKDVTPEWYRQWFKNVAKPGANRRTILQFGAEHLANLMIRGVSWTLCELPRAPAADPTSLAEQDGAGLRDAYVCTVLPESVTNWETNSETGDLLWARTTSEEMRQDHPFAQRSEVTERYTTYLPNGWMVHEFKHETKQTPGADAEAVLVDSGTHSFGRVQLRRVRCPPGLYAMGKIGGMARALLNKICALSMSEIKHLLPELYEFSAPERSRGVDKTVSEVQKDPKRAVNQKRGPGHAQVRGSEDRAEYVAPPTDGYEFVQQTIKDLIGWIHDVVEVMAASEDAQGAALRRSAESKAVDTSKEHIVQYAIGDLLRDHLRDVLETVAVGRGDGALVWTVKGMEDFADVDSASELNEATIFAAIPWNSPTFVAKVLARHARSLLGEEATPELMATIEEEMSAGAVHQGEADTAQRDQAIDPPPPAAPPR